MKPVIGVFAKSVLTLTKATFVGSVVLLAGTELTRDLNLNIRSGRVPEGEPAKVVAQVIDPAQAGANVVDGKALSGAQRTISAQVVGLEADARQKETTADAATESEEELLAKQRKHIKLTSTEELRLRELQVKAQELAIKEAEARLKAAEATNAEQSAAVTKKVNNWILETEDAKPHGNFARRAAEKEFRKLGW
jgi:hypothetical protein